MTKDALIPLKGASSPESDFSPEGGTGVTLDVGHGRSDAGAPRPQPVTPRRNKRHALYRAWKGWLHRTFDVRRYSQGKSLFDLHDLSRFARYRNEGMIRGLCSNAYLGNNLALCRVLGRYSMFVDTRDIGFSTHMLLSGYWEMWVTEVIAERVRPGMKVVDCGANLGYFSLLMAELVGPTGHVDAFEPNPEMANRLSRTMAVNGFSDRTTVHMNALAETAGDALLYMPDGEPKNAFIGDMSALRDDIGSIVVPTVRLDELPNALEIDVIKIDVEGAEERVWGGMRRLLEQDRPLTVILEFAVCRYSDPAGFIDRITAYGFDLNVIDVERGVVPITRDEIMAYAPDVDQMLVLER